MSRGCRSSNQNGMKDPWNWLVSDPEWKQESSFINRLANREIPSLKLIRNDSEKDLVEWANKMISKDDVKVTSFKDKSLKTGRYLIELCSGIEPRAVNWDIVTSGESEEDRTNNAKYAISIARKLGATIFCVWDDIVKVNFKMILIFVCALHDVHNELKAKKKAGKGEETKEEIKEEAE